MARTMKPEDMKPEDMHQMMEGMMSKMFSAMKVEDRIEFCSTMMPKCLTKVFEGVSPEAKEKLKKETFLAFACYTS